MDRLEEREHASKHTTNIIRSDAELTEQFERFCNQEFNDTNADSKSTMSQENRRALNIMEDFIKLKNSHYEIDNLVKTLVYKIIKFKI